MNDFRWMHWMQWQERGVWCHFLSGTMFLPSGWVVCLRRGGGVSASSRVRVCLQRMSASRQGVWQPPPPVDRQIPVKTLPSRKFVAITRIIPTYSLLCSSLASYPATKSQVTDRIFKLTSIDDLAICRFLNKMKLLLPLGQSQLSFS